MFRNRNGGRGWGRGQGRGAGFGLGRGAGQGWWGQGWGRGFFGANQAEGWGTGYWQNRPLSEMSAGIPTSEKKSWLENFKAHLTRRMSEVDEELSKY